MPQYTTSFNSNKKPRYRTAAPSRPVRGGRSATPQLRGGARKPPRRKNAQYLRHSQGFGGRGRNTHGYGGNARKPYAIIVVGCAFLLFVASIIWYANRSVEITLNGEKTTVRINSTIEHMIEDKELDLKAGNLLAVDDSVLEKGGGTRCTVKLDGKEVKPGALDTTQLEGGEKLEVGDGVDVYEEHDIQATEIAPTLTVNGSGPVQYVATWGEAGRSEVWTGKVSGKTADKGVVKQVVNCEVERTSVLPSKRGEKYVALTFDEAPSAHTEEILQVLKEKGVTATFFVSGEHATQYPKAVKAIADAGHEIGSNGMSDVNLTELSGEELRTQISQGFDAIEQAGGGRTGLLRAPFGEFSEANWAEAMDLLSAQVAWNLDSGDWLLKGAPSVVETVVGSARNGNIVLLTDNDATSAQTVEALGGVIDGLREQGFTIVSVSELVQTDEDLAKAVKLGKASMPKGATLPQVPADDADAEPTAE